MELTLQPYGRFWAVYERGALLCVTVYKKGAHAVIDRISTGARKEKRSAEVPIIRSA
jgi:hypothetical protein